MTREDYLGAKLTDLLNPELRNDPLIKDAYEYAKDAVRRDIENKVEWIGEVPPQTEVEKRFYDEVCSLVESEIQSEANGEMKRR